MFTYRISQDRAVVLVRGVGRLGFDSTTAIVNRILESESKGPMPMLVDFREVDLALSLRTLRRIVRYADTTGFLVGRPIAVIVGRARVQRGVARMAAAMAATRGGLVAVFDTPLKGRTWLQSCAIPDGE
ncbi:MAG: hypothetical protein GF331_13945 [Chitinivibrionales bacterium]|nr:hypothetical protein [Chitinivibrionales bacterium]